MDRLITSHVLRYLLEHQFKNKSDMARQLDLQLRTIQKVFENIDNPKAGTIALDKAIGYCARHNISLDEILHSYDAERYGEKEAMSVETQSMKAYARLRLDRPPNLSEEGERMFDSMLRFLQRSSAQVCPYCETWCNPWSGRRSLYNPNCYIGHMALEIQQNVAEVYGEKEKDIPPTQEGNTHT